MNISWEDKETNFKRCAEYIDIAVSEGSHLVAFPEMVLTGFSMNVAATSEDDLKTVDQFRSLAIEKNIHIGFGWVEKLGERGRNHYTIISPEGKIVSDYVKLHPFSFANETEHFEPGEKLPGIIEINGVSLATFICYDLRFPEIYQAVSKNTDLILTSANWPVTRSEHWCTLLKARAIENQSFIAGVNCFGDIGNQKYSGNSGVYDPQGNYVYEIEGEGLHTFSIDPDQVKKYRESFPLKNDRKTEFYKKVL